jgi:hypothetical protein
LGIVPGTLVGNRSEALRCTDIVAGFTASIIIEAPAQAVGKNTIFGK